MRRDPFTRNNNHNNNNNVERRHHHTAPHPPHHQQQHSPTLTRTLSFPADTDPQQEHPEQRGGVGPGAPEEEHADEPHPESFVLVLYKKEKNLLKTQEENSWSE